MAHCIINIKDRADGSVRINIEYKPVKEADGKSFAQDIGNVVADAVKQGVEKKPKRKKRTPAE